MADLVGFKSDGVWVALSTGRSFAPATLWSTTYSAGSGGWSSYDLYPRALGDVDGSGRAAIVGFGGRKTYVTRYDHQVRMYYDADGNRVVSINDGARAVYIGDWVETGTSYYHLGGQRVAKRAAGGVTYLHGDHLGSTSKTTGAASSAQLYEAYGAKRGASEVDAPYRYTGQRWEENDALDIYTYKARWYDPDRLAAKANTPEARVEWIETDLAVGARAPGCHASHCWPSSSVFRWQAARPSPTTPPRAST